jgi:hypothetical protein
VKAVVRLNRKISCSPRGLPVAERVRLPAVESNATRVPSPDTDALWLEGNTVLPLGGLLGLPQLGTKAAAASASNA